MVIQQVAAVLVQRFAQVVGNVLARHRIDGRPAHFQSQARHGYRAHAFAAAIDDLAHLPGQHAQIDGQMRLVGAVRIVASELLDPGMRTPLRALALDHAIAHGKAHAIAIGQQAGDVRRNQPVHQSHRAGACCRGGTGAGGEAGAGAFLGFAFHA